MRFVIDGHPRTKKTSQRVIRNKRTGATRIIPSEVTLQWSNDAQLQFQSQMHRYRGQGVSKVKRWNLRAVFYRGQETTADLIGHLQALCDVLEGAEVIANDRLIGGMDGSRLAVDKARPRVEVELTEMEAP